MGFTSGDLGKLIAIAEREKLTAEELQEKYEDLKRVIAENSPFTVCYGQIDGPKSRIKLTVELK